MNITVNKNGKELTVAVDGRLDTLTARPILKKSLMRFLTMLRSLPSTLKSSNISPVRDCVFLRELWTLWRNRAARCLWQTQTKIYTMFLRSPVSLKT